MDCRRKGILLPVLGLLAGLWLVPAAPGEAAATRVELTDAETGRAIATRTLCAGEHAVLRWRNSLFGLDVTEVFVAGPGRLELASVTFADPAGGDPPRVAPQDLDDLYHTGGPFRVEGLSRPFTRIVFRVGEIGNPVLQTGEAEVHFLREVGFGGAVRMTASPAPAAPADGCRSVRAQP
jgi:hypothetical protein